MNYPAVTKYDPKPSYLKKNFIKDGLGVLRSPRAYSYINDQKTPGPGGYNLTKDDSYLPNRYVAGKIDRAPRDSSIKPRLAAPGPGSYDLVKPQGKFDWEDKRSKAEMYREMRRPPYLRNC